MEKELMQLNILLPYRIFDNIADVRRVVLETSKGSYGLLPQRLDCVAALVPGIFTYETGKGDILYLAIDEGLLVKAGLKLMLSVRHAIGGPDLGKLHESVKKQFLILDENEKNIRSVMAKMESGLMNSLSTFHKT